MLPRVLSFLPSPRHSLFFALLWTVVVNAGCATYKVDHVTNHEGRLYLTTEKKTTFFYVWVLNSEQAIASCKEIKGTLDCTELAVTINGDDWEQ